MIFYVFIPILTDISPFSFSNYTIANWYL